MRTKRKRRRAWCVTLLAIVAVVAMLSGCGSRTGKTGASPSIEEIRGKIEQAVDLGEMKTGDLNKLQKLYKIDPGIVDGFILYTSASNVRADELAVIKLKDQRQADNVKANIERRIAAQKIKFKDYRPNEYYVVENHVLKTDGPYILFAVSGAADQMEQAFDDAF